MADDSSYATFLAKANEDPTSGTRPDTHDTSTSQSRGKFDPSTTPSSAIPASLQNLPDTPYVSDTDGDWEPVFFSYAGDAAPTADDFRAVLEAKNGKDSGTRREVEELSVADFDPRGEYGEVVERVRMAGVGGDGKGRSGGGGGGGVDVKVFRVQMGATRVEYYVLTVGERKLVGVVAKAVES